MLIDKLTEYGQSGVYPFHMPGHKRQTSLGITSFPNPFSVDITEIDGFDNLHHAEGILRESMDRAAEIYGADRTFYMVNGSTGGILSAICGLTEPGEGIAIARNSHKSAYHAMVLNRLIPSYIFPEESDGHGIQGGITAEAVERVLSEQPGIRTVFITSPTYEGIVSDVAAIAEVSHRYGASLIVDEAHGAHFPFGESFPKPAISCGADVVIQSLHKTLPSLTQTALLHVKSGIVKPERLERYLSIFQSSSPSYVFLASIESCIRYMDGEGRADMERYGERLRRFMSDVSKLRNLELLTDEVCGNHGVFDRDVSKLVVFPKAGSGLTGTELAELLRSRYKLEAEMACSRYVILMTSPMDTEEGLSRLSRALSEMDREMDLRETWRPLGRGTTGADSESGAEMHQDLARFPDPGTWLPNPERVVGLADAWNGEREMISLSEAAGRISASFITVYPPGVPMLVPGELITAEAVRLIEANRALGLTVEGITENGNAEPGTGDASGDGDASGIGGSAADLTVWIPVLTQKKIGKNE